MKFARISLPSAISAFRSSIWQQINNIIWGSQNSLAYRYNIIITMDVHCQTCGLIYSVVEQASLDNDEFISTQCPHCRTKCNICLICSKCYFNSSRKGNDYRSIKNHMNKCHPQRNLGPIGQEIEQSLQNFEAVLEERLPNQEQHQDIDEDDQHEFPLDEYFPSNDEGIEVDIGEDYAYEQILQENMIIELHSFDSFSNEKSNQYFWQEYICNQHGESFGGVRGIVWRSMFRLRICDQTKITDLRDSRMLFNMAQHVMSNTEEQNESFLEILQDIRDRTIGYKTTISIPHDLQSAENILRENRFAIFGNLPYEEVHVIDGHACISLIGLIQHVYAHGIPIGWTEETDVPGETRRTHNIHGSEAMDELLETMKMMNQEDLPSKYGSLLLWSDGFIRSYVKQKDNNVWIMTVTLPDPDGCATSKYHTYCLAVGKSSNGHQLVVEYYLKEIEKLMHGVSLFDTKSGRYTRVQMGLLAYIADRPERHAILNQAERGIFGKRTLWSAFIDHDHLPYCQSCFTREVTALLADMHSPSVLSNCGRCCQWDMNSSSPANKKVKPQEVTLTEHYPRTCDPNSPTPPRLRPVPTSHFRPVELDFWWMICAVKFAAHNIIHHSWKKDPTRSYLKSCAIPDRVINKLYTRFNKMDPNNDDQGVEVASNEYIPYVWLSVACMGAWIDAGMHHVFHGVVARIMALMEEVMTEEKKNATFDDVVNPHLSEIKSMRLDWLHIKNLPKTQWLAEDELGFSRIACFIYGQFFLNVTLRDATNTTPLTRKLLRQMIVAMHVMIALLMTPRDPVLDIIDRHIKLFLSCCDRFSKAYYVKDTVPFWASTSNFPSLLNLRAQIKKYGPIRWYWEGTRERFIQTVKKVLVSMRKTTPYFERKMVVLQKLTFMEWIAGQLRKGDKEKKKEYKRMYYRYESIHEIREKVAKGEVLSGVTTRNGDDYVKRHFWIVFGSQNSTVSIVPLSKKGDYSEGKKFIGLAYHEYELCENDIWSDVSIRELEANTAHYCLLLPFKEIKKRFENKYAVIFSDWDNIDIFGEKNLPTICPVEFV
jgi:hypothetical protein